MFFNISIFKFDNKLSLSDSKVFLISYKIISKVDCFIEMFLLSLQESQYKYKAFALDSKFINSLFPQLLHIEVCIFETKASFDKIKWLVFTAKPPN